MKQLFWSLAIAAMLLLASCAKLVVVKVPSEADSKIKAEGIFYALPKTVVRAQVNVDRTELKAGTYAQYAEVFVPGETPVCATDCAQENKKKYSLEKNVVFTTFGEPDAEHVYMVKFVGRGAVDQNIAMTWTETGLLSTASASATNRTSDVIVSGLKLAAGIGSKAAFGAVATDAAGNPITSCPDASANDPWILRAFNGVISINAGVTLIGNYCALPKVTRDADKYNETKSKLVFLNALNAYMKSIFPLADSRTKILSGAAGLLEPTELLTKIESLLDQQVKTLFLGSKDTKTWAGSIDIRHLPSPGTPGLAALHLSAENGFCIGEGGEGGSAVSISPDAKSLPDGLELLEGVDCSNATPYYFTTQLSPTTQLFESVKDHTTDPQGELSFRYRIPAQVKAELRQGKTIFGLGVFSVAQFGKVEALPANRHSKALSYDLAMVEATGGLKSFKIGTTGSVDSGTIDSLAGIGGSLLDAKNAAAKADKAAKDDVTTLTRQDTLLKLKDDICTLQKKYGLACTVQP